jgi:DNA primase
MQLGFYYCDRLERVVMPLHDNGVLVYWQARGFDTKHAKYINPLVSKDKLAAKFGSGPTLVLTEDILSAYRCSKVTQAWSIMGTAITDGVANLIRAQNKPVIIMLDPDPAGIKGNIKARKQLSILGVDCRIVVPNKDPKLLPRKELECLLT